MQKLHKEHTDNSNLVPMGWIVGAFGIKGWVKIKIDTHEIDTLDKYNDIYLLVSGKYTLYKLEQSYVQNDLLNAKFEEIADRDAAAALKGVVIAVNRAEFPATNPDEYYWVDLVGCTVYNTSGDYFGIVANLMETGANSVLVVRDDVTERLIPFIGVYVSDVDLKNKKITVYWELDY